LIPLSGDAGIDRDRQSKIEVFDVGGFRHTAPDEDPDHPHAWKCFLQDIGRGAEMRAGRQHVVKETDGLRRGISQIIV
jgi:hypothetical protein